MFNEVMAFRIKQKFHFIGLMSLSFLVKMFKLNIEPFHSYKSILSILPC